MRTNGPLPISLSMYIYISNVVINQVQRLIAPFQRGETPTFIQHVKAGLTELEKSKDRGVLVFSGYVVLSTLH